MDSGQKFDMEEILELKQNLLSGNIDQALYIVEELEEVGRKSIY